MSVQPSPRKERQLSGFAWGCRGAWGHRRTFLVFAARAPSYKQGGHQALPGAAVGPGGHGSTGSP